MFLHSYLEVNILNRMGTSLLVIRHSNNQECGENVPLKSSLFGIVQFFWTYNGKISMSNFAKQLWSFCFFWLIAILFFIILCMILSDCRAEGAAH